MAMLHVFHQGCSIDGHCYNVGYSQFDNAACKNHKCIASTDSTGASYPDIVAQHGNCS